MRGGTSPTTLRAASETAPSRYSPRHKKNLETGREHTVVLVPPAYCGTGRPLAEELWIDWWTRPKQHMPILRLSSSVTGVSQLHVLRLGGATL